MSREPNAVPKALLVLLVAYGAASLLHFIHNAEFLADYPNMPAWLSRAQVYLVWLGMTVVGLSGWVLVKRGHVVAGLLAVVAYAALGLDSLGHYVFAPLSAHSLAMNATILLEVTAAGLVLVEATRLMARRTLSRFSP